MLARPSTSSSDASSDSSSSSDGEQLPAQAQTTRSGRTSAPAPRHVPNPGQLFSEEAREAGQRRGSGGQEAEGSSSGVNLSHRR
jgi:hypothetical protein